MTDRSLSRSPYYLVFLTILSTSLLLAPARGQNLIWGVKSLDPVSQPPATLFNFTTTGSFTSVGVVTLDGAQIDVDGLAMDNQLRLYGFKVTYPTTGSQLLLIDKTNANAVPIGPVHAGRDIRGATFDHQGRLLALDTAQAELLQIDPLGQDAAQIVAQRVQDQDRRWALLL